VPQDINPDSSTKSAPVGGESLKVTKPLAPNIKETVQESRKPRSPGGTQNSPGADGAPSSPPRAASSPNLVGASSGPKSAEFPRTSPTSYRSYRLRAASGYHPGEGLSMPRPKNPPRQYLRVAESLFDNPKFMQDGFHISRFITMAVDTEVDQANTKALYFALKTTSTHLYVSIF
jgi:hypothetical protein